MNGILNKNQLTILEKNEFDNPIITEIDSILDNFFRGCHNKYYHKFKSVCIYNIKLINVTNNEINSLTISGKSMDLYDLNKKLKVARRSGFKCDRINKPTIKFSSHLRYKNISYCLKSKIPMCHRQFFRVISQNPNPDYLEKFCNDMDNPFRFAIRKWINQLK